MWLDLKTQMLGMDIKKMGCSKSFVTKSAVDLLSVSLMLFFMLVKGQYMVLCEQGK